MLGKELGHEVLTSQMQHNADYTETDQKINASYSLEGTVLENVEKIEYLGITITNDLKWNTHVSNIYTKAKRTLGFLDETKRHVHETLKSRLTKDWYVQSWSVVVQFGTP